MKVKILLNGTMREAEISSDQLLIDFVRDHGCYSVKRGCETSNCGLCTVFVDDKPVLSCSMLTARVDGCKVDTLEGLQEEAKEFGAFVADQGAEQCGFCNPGMIMNAIAMFRENPERFVPLDEISLVGPEAGPDGRRPRLLTYPAWAAPILAHGLLFVRGADRLVCVELARDAAP